MAFSVLGFSVPVFVLAYILILVFSIELDWLPVQGYRPHPRGTLGVAAPPDPAEHRARHRLHRADRAHHARQHARRARAGLHPHRAGQGARARARCSCGHALKNAAVPIVTVIGIGIALLIGGAIVTETVFAIPGVGRLTVDAILRRDYPIIQGVILIFSARLRADQPRGRPELHVLRPAHPLLTWLPIAHRAHPQSPSRRPGGASRDALRGAIRPRSSAASCCC